jgi:chromosome partitioning protein
MLTNALAVMNGKGGVFKTSLSAQIAGLAAASDWRVLVVELDRQGNLGRDLGFLPKSDGGAGLLASVETGVALYPLDNVRPNLDVIPGGPSTRTLYSRFGGTQGGGLPRFDQLVRVLEPIKDRYDLIVFDCPPGEQSAQLAALMASRAVIIPSQVDDASFDGVAMVLEGVLSVAERDNPDLEVLGVVLTGVQTSAKKVLTLARQELAARLDTGTEDFEIKIYAQTIRFLQSAAFWARRSGMLVSELETAAANQPKYYERHKTGVKTEALPTSTGGLAEDYQILVEEVLHDFSALSR